jgi:hypothetical protein
MYNLFIKELKLNIQPFYYLLPWITGAFMLIPGWLYFVVFLYFFFFTIPSIYSGYKTQNDLVFSLMLPVSRNDIVISKILVVVFLELLHLLAAVTFGFIHLKLYPNFIYLFFGPSLGFWGLSFIMLGVFNLIYFPVYYKNSYHYGPAMIWGIIGASIFATICEWIGVKNPYIYELFKGMGRSNVASHLIILFMGILLFISFTFLSMKISTNKMLKVEL